MSPRRVLVLAAFGMTVMGNAMPVAADVETTPHPPDTEILADAAGAYAQRTRGPDGEWGLPEGDAVLIDEAWWTPLRPLAEGIAPAPRSTKPPPSASATGSPPPRRADSLTGSQPPRSVT